MNQYIKYYQSNHLKCAYPYDIWEQYYENSDINQNIHENRLINSSQGNIFVHNVLFQGRYNQAIIRLENFANQFLISNSIFENTTRINKDPNIYQNGGSCVQHQICVKNVIGNFASQYYASHSKIISTNINYIIESSFINSQGGSSPVVLVGGKIFIDKSNISKSYFNSGSWSTTIYCIINSEPNSNVSYSTFKNNTGFNCVCLFSHRNFSGTLHHLIFESNLQSIILIQAVDNSNIIVRDCNIINNNVDHLYANSSSTITFLNCYIARNSFRYTLETAQIEEIDIDNSFIGQELCNGDLLFLNKLIIISVSIENENKPIIQYDENIKVKVVFNPSLIKEITIESWIDDDRSKSFTQNKTFGIDNTVIFEHNLNEIYYNHTLHVVSYSQENPSISSDNFSLEFSRRNKASITVTESFYTEKKVVLSISVIESYESEFNDCKIHLSFDNISDSKQIPVYSKEIGIICDIPKNIDLKTNLIRLQITNSQGSIICETYHQVSNKIKSKNLMNHNECNPVFSSRRR